MGVYSWLATTYCDISDTALGIVGIGPGNITPACDVIAEQQSQTYGDPNNPYAIYSQDEGFLGLENEIKTAGLILVAVLAFSILYPTLKGA